MSNAFQSILNLLLGLFGSNQGNGSDGDGASGDSSSGTATQGSDCAIPGDLEIPPVISHDNVETVSSLFDTFTFRLPREQIDRLRTTFSAQAVRCQVIVRPELEAINVRSGPGLAFEPPIASAKGGTQFELVGVSQSIDGDDRWFAVRLGNTSGWIRSDLISLSTECRTVDYLPDNISVGPLPPPPSGGKLFNAPTTAPISQGYSQSAHPGIDMASSVGTRLISPAPGICIRRIACTACTPESPNRQPVPGRGCPTLHNDIEWGFGYGNFLVMRYDYAVLPDDLRKEMDSRNLTNGFAYFLVGHLDEMNVSLGQSVSAGQVIGATGNTGCSSAPHLHFEVRIGRVSEVDGVWTQQRAVNPKLMFNL